MKRARIGMAIVLSATLALTLAFATMPAEAGKKRVKVKTSATIDYDGGIVGEIVSKKPRCRRGRSVEVRYFGPEPKELVGFTVSKKGGDWSLSTSFDDAGTYQALVVRKLINLKHKKLVCRGGESPRTILVP